MEYDVGKQFEILNAKIDFLIEKLEKTSEKEKKSSEGLVG